jgi:hypothetical protein
VLQPSLEDKAIAVFMSHYVLGKSQSFEYLTSFYAMPDMDEHLSACISAVSLAELASHQKSPGLLKQARESYSISLRLTNLALQTDKKAGKDSTLLAILLLDLFEKITAIHNKRSLPSITEHINGAAKLVQLRGLGQFDSPFGPHMFMQFITLLMESCAQCKVRVSPEIIALLKYAKCISDPTDYNWLILEAFENYTALRADIAAGAFSDPRDVIAEAQRQEDNCAALCMLFKSKWRYTTLLTNDTRSAYEGIYHVYTIPFLSVRAWNTIRIGRIIINEIIREQFVLGSSTTPPMFNPADHIIQFKAAGDAITEMTFEICGCVPQYMMTVPSCSPQNGSSAQTKVLGFSSSDPSKSHTSDMKYTQAEQAGAYSLIFPLFIIGRSPERLLKLHLWALDRLHYIGNVIGLSDATMVAELLMQKIDTDPWSVAAMLGGHNGQVYG